MIRPEAKAAIHRWRELLAGGAAILLGLWWLGGPAGLLTVPALALVAAGGALVWIGVQRARFRSAGEGPGVVQVDEGQITYYGPLTGGTVALRELASIAFEPGARPAHWRLAEPGQPALMIPVNAEGADALFDAFATLPGFRMAQALAAIRTPPAQTVVIWRRNMSISAQPTLH